MSTDTETENNWETADANEAAKTPVGGSNEAAKMVESLQEIGEPVKSAGGAKKTLGTVASRDLSVSTLVHLLGLPTQSQLASIDASMDLLARKLQTLSAQMEKVSSEIQVLASDNASERVDFQLNEIRALLKRAMLSSTAAKPAAEPPKAPRKVLESAPAEAKASEELGEHDALAEFDSIDDASFQSDEAAKVREQMENKNAK